MVGAEIPWVAAVQEVASQRASFGYCATYHRTIVLVTLLLLSAWRPTGGGQLVALARSVDDPRVDPNLERGVLALEVIAAVLFVAGLVGTVLFGKMIDDCVLFLPDDTDSIAGATGLTDPKPLVGHLAVATMLFGVVLWGVSWVAEGLSLGRNRPWRDG